MLLLKGMAGERVGQEQPARTNRSSGWKCREGVTPAEIPLVAVCMHRDMDTDRLGVCVWRTAKETGTTCAAN